MIMITASKIENSVTGQGRSRHTPINSSTTGVMMTFILQIVETFLFHDSRAQRKFAMDSHKQDIS
jgi:hypothetical protein